MFLIIFLVFALCFYIFFLKDQIRKLALASRIKGPPALPLFGNGLDLINKNPQGLKFQTKRFLLN